MREDLAGAEGRESSEGRRGELVSRPRALAGVIRALWQKIRSASHVSAMDVLPSGNLFRELQDVTDTGYFEWKLSLEDYWQQVSDSCWAMTVPLRYASERAERISIV